MALFLVLLVAGTVRAATVEAGIGYTNDFSAQPAASDWATYSVAGGGGDTYEVDADVNLNVTAGSVTTQTTADPNNPANQSATATWSSTGFYLQTRPTGNRYTALMGKFVNNTATNATQITISYVGTIAAGGIPEDSGKGTRVYYSLTGLTNSWTNIAALNTTASVDGSFNFSANVALNWSNGASLYLLWADDNASAQGFDAGDQIDNFSLQVTAGLPLSLACLVTSPTNNATFVTGTPVALTALAAGGNPPYQVRYWTNSGAGNTIFDSVGTLDTAPYNASLDNLTPGTYNIYASVTDANGAGMTANSATNTYVVANPIAMALTAPADGASFDHTTSVGATATVLGGTAPYSVQFYLDDTANGAPVISAPYTHAFGPLFVGDHTIKAIVTDARGWTSNSAVHTVHITGPLAVLLMPANGTSYNYGQAVTLAAAPGGGTGPYTVAFYTNDQAVGTISSAPFTTNLGVLPVGSHATYVQVSDSSTPSPQQVLSSTNLITILPNPLLVTLTSPTNGQSVSTNAGITARATASVAAPLSVSSVEFFVDGVSVGSVTNAPYSRQDANPTVGIHTVYAVATDSLGRQSYTATNQVTCIIDPLANDNFDNRFALGTPAHVTGANAGATTQPGELASSGFFTRWGATLWWKWTAPATGTARIDTYGSSFNTLLAVYTGSAVNALNQRTLNDNAPGMADVSLVTFNAQVGTEYQIQVGGIQGFGPGGGTIATGTILLNVSMPPSITITSPANGSVIVAGSNFVLSANASAPLGGVSKVDFYRGGVLLGTLSSAPYTFVVSNAPAGTNTYYAVATDSIGQTATSANLNVLVANLGITIITPADGTFYLNTAPIGVSIYTSLPSGAITNVGFFVDNQKFAEDATAPFSVVWSNVVGGSHTFTAVAKSDAGLTYRSQPVAISVAQTLVASNSVWKYLDNGTDQGTSWIAPAFDDSSWAAGPAPLGYGDSNGRQPLTTNSYGLDASNKFITTYYRQAPVVPNPANFAMLVMYLQRDDGAVVYLNGVEAGRYNMPTGPVNYTTLAFTATDDGAANYGYLVGTNLLLQGTNYLAVEIHQDVTNSTDIWFDLQLLGVPPIIHNDYPLVSLVSPTNNSLFLVPSIITISATASDSDGTIAKVEFYEGNTKLGEATNSPYNLNVAAQEAGIYTLTAVATDNQGGVTPSDPITITVFDVSSRWVSYNDHYAGPGTAPNATAWNVFGTEGGAPGREGQLRDIQTGVPLDASLSILNLDAFPDMPCGAPVSGTPAYDLFNGYIDFGSGDNNHAILITSDSLVLHLFTGLDPLRHYNFRGTVVGGVKNYTNRWTLFRIVSAASFTPAHTANVLTSAAQPGSIAPDEAAMNTGDNAAGDVVGWDNIVPGPDGSFAILSTQYLGPAPGNARPGPVAYAPVAIRLEEFGGNPLVEVTKPVEGAILTGPTNIIVAAQPTSILPITNMLFLANDSFIGQASTSPYTTIWSNPPFGSLSFRAVAFDAEGFCSTSAPVTMTLITPPTNTIPPFVYGQTPLAESTVTNLTNIQVVFSQPVTGVDARDLLINDLPATNVIGSGTNYLFSFPQPPYGSVSVKWATDHAITDFSWPVHLTLDQTDPENRWNYNLMDRTPPLVIAKNPPSGAALTNLTQVTVTFSEPVTGVNASDFLVNSTPAYAVNGFGSNYTFSFSQPRSGSVLIMWAANHGITDLADSHNAFNASSPGAVWTYSLDSRTILIQSNTPYHFLKGYAEASSPTNAWQAPGFDDSSWSNEAAPFYFGDTGYTNTLAWGTPLTDMNSNYSSIYLRKSFVVPNASAITNLTMTVQSDDGFIAWINGVEVKRYNVTSNDIPYNGLALASVPEPTNNGAAWSNYTLPNPQLYLVPGTNVLAVHALNESLTNNDFGLNLQLYTYLANTEVEAPRISAKNPAPGSVYSLTNITVTFSERVTNVEASDLHVNGQPATGLSSSNTVFTFSFPQPPYGPVAISWAANHGIIDLDLTPKPFDNTASGSTWQYTLLNASAPYVVTLQPAQGATINQLTQIGITFNEPVTGVNASDLLLNGTPATGLSGSGSNYTFTFPQPAYGTVTVTWATNHGIQDLEIPPNDFQYFSSSNTWTYTLVDQTPPAVATQNPRDDSTVMDLTQITVTFTEPVAGVDSSDLLINGRPASSVTGSNATYTFTFPQPNATSISVTWAANHSIRDLASVSNAFDASDPGNTWTYTTVDNVPPSLAGVFPGPFTTVRSLRQITLAFDEPVQGVSANVLTLNGAAAQQVSGSGPGPYTFAFDQPATGAVQVALSTAISDLAFQPNPYRGSNWTYVLNTNLPPPTITRGPYLQLQTSNSIFIRWRTGAASDSRVQYGLTFDSCTNVRNDAVVTTEHIVKLTNLAPNTKYSYAIGTTDGSMVADTNFSFATSPVSAKPTRIWVFGDNRLTSSSLPLQTNQNAVQVKNAFLQYTGNRPADLGLNTGDLGGLNGTDNELQVGYFDTYPEILRQSVMWVSLGNHEENTSNAEPYLMDFSLPSAGEAGGVPSGTNRYYSFNYGNIHFVSLDSQGDLSVSGPMYKWCQQDLASNRSDWLIAIWHAPPYSITTTHNSDTESGMIQMRQRFVPLLESNGVDLVVNGHNHLYERTYLIDGHYGASTTFDSEMLKDGGNGRPDGTGAYRKSAVGPVPNEGAIYATMGGSGAQLYPVISFPALFYGESAFGSMVVDINGNRLDATYLRFDGATNDHFTIIKGPIAPTMGLSIVHSGPGITVSWPASADGYVLQASTSVGLSANWQTINSGINTNNNLKLYSFTPTPESPAVFFRLQKQ